MAGLFDTLSLGSKSLSTYRKAIDTTGHNLANVHTTGYTRQRVLIETTTTANGTMGPVGTGAEAVKIVRLHNDFANRQLQVESSIEGSLNVRNESLQEALTALQETISRNGTNGTTTNGISQSLSNFFTAAQGLSANPSSIPDRQAFVQRAQELATKFNSIDSRLGSLQEGLDQRIQLETNQVNSLAGEIANLNAAIVSEETLSTGDANDLRDARQVKLEQLSQLVKVDATEGENGTLNISVGGNLLVEGREVVSTLETFDSADGRTLVRVAGQPDELTLTGGSIEGAISVRDGQLASLRTQLNTLAETFITEVNAIHSAGYSLTGTTGANFFVGSNASDIAVNVDMRDPALVQAAGNTGEAGDNSIIRSIAELDDKTHAALSGQTFSGKHAQTVSWLGQEVANARGELEDQAAISKFFRDQRDSISGVSVDEEMANLVIFQKAFQASAKLISMTDEMLSTIIQM